MPHQDAEFYRLVAAAGYVTPLSGVTETKLRRLIQLVRAEAQAEPPTRAPAFRGLDALIRRSLGDAV